ncbi:MAG: hypothetical protein QM779_11485 [Propionicimonas sp.]|uniref:hypothetical protein n=1 Tax=Propionicimonas sp. TaxID=1955623 RepID=UPI003D10AEFA
MLALAWQLSPHTKQRHLDQGRVHLHDQTGIPEAVYTAWRHDLDQGRTSLMLGHCNELTTQLNARARADLINEGTVHGPETRLRTGLHVAAGDLIVTRENRRSLSISPTDYVKNGDWWQALHVHPDGPVDAKHEATGRTLTLPAWYVRDHVDLGCARTIHTAQGSTVDTCHIALNGQGTRQLLYNGATRGRLANHLYLYAGCDGDPATAINPDALKPATAGELNAGNLPRRIVVHKTTVFRDTEVNGVFDAWSAGGEIECVRVRGSTRWRGARLVAARSATGAVNRLTGRSTVARCSSYPAATPFSTSTAPRRVSQQATATSIRSRRVFPALFSSPATPALGHWSEKPTTSSHSPRWTGTTTPSTTRSR